MTFKVENPPAWNRKGNGNTDPTVDRIGTTDATDLVFIVNNNEFMRLDENNVVAGGPAIDLRPAEAVFLANFILMQNTLQLTNIENGTASEIRFDLNNDQGGNFRLFRLSTDDAGTFGSFLSILGNLAIAQPNSFSANGVFDFDIQNTGLDSDMNLKVNDGGAQTTLVQLEADGAQSIPQVNINTIVSILGDSDITYPGSPFDIADIGSTVSGMSNVNPSNSSLNTATTWTYTSAISGLFSSTNGLIGTAVMQPSGLGAGTDTHNLRGLIGTAQFALGGSRTMTAVTGLFGQASVRTSGTVTNCIGLGAQVVTVFGGTITNAVALQANAPGNFLGGTIENGTSLLSIGGSSGTVSNWNAQFTNSAVPSKFEGNLIVGQTTETEPAFRMFTNGDSKTTGEVVYQDKFETSKMHLMAM